MLAFGELLKQPNIAGLVFCLLTSVSLSVSRGDTAASRKAVYERPHRARSCPAATHARPRASAGRAFSCLAC